MLFPYFLFSCLVLAVLNKLYCAVTGAVVRSTQSEGGIQVDDPSKCDGHTGALILMFVLYECACLLCCVCVFVVLRVCVLSECAVY